MTEPTSEAPAKQKRKPKKAKDGLRAKKGGGWTFRIYLFGSKSGPRKMFTLPKGTTRSEAEAYLAAEKAKAKALAGKPFLQHFTVRQAWADMETYYRGSGAAENTVLSVIRAGTHVLPLLGPRRLADLRGADVESYQRTRLEEGAAAPDAGRVGQVQGCGRGRRTLGALGRTAHFDRRPGTR